MHSLKTNSWQAARCGRCSQRSCGKSPAAAHYGRCCCCCVRWSAIASSRPFRSTGKQATRRCNLRCWQTACRRSTAFWCLRSVHLRRGNAAVSLRCHSRSWAGEETARCACSCNCHTAHPRWCPPNSQRCLRLDSTSIPALSAVTLWRILGGHLALAETVNLLFAICLRPAGRALALCSASISIARLLPRSLLWPSPSDHGFWILLSRAIRATSDRIASLTHTAPFEQGCCRAVSCWARRP